MLSALPHERLDVYQKYLDVTRRCEELISRAPTAIAVLDHLDRAIESIGINLMRANTRPPGSPLRSSYLDISIASAHECAASLDICLARRAIDAKTHAAVLVGLWRIRGMLIGMKRVRADRVSEECAPYGLPRFPFSDLEMYQVSLDVIRWIHDFIEELTPTARTRRKLDISTTGTALNIAEGHGRTSPADQNRFMKLAEEHAFQTILILDLMVARSEVPAPRVSSGKATQSRVISMLHAWCVKNGEREREENG